MHNKTLHKYIQAFSSLNVNKSTLKGESPHKPILLLSIIDGIEEGWINSPIIEISPQLVAVFKKRWAELVVGNNHLPRFVLPFFHMKKESFWKLNRKKGVPPFLKNSSISSFKKLNLAVKNASIDLELFELLLDIASRILLRKTITARYFPKHIYLLPSSAVLASIENYILKDASETYDIRKVSDIKKEIEFVRGGLFKSVVPKIYNYTCCISEMSVSATVGASMIDACHIEPIRVNGNDNITNGITLCPNLHRAFDRGLITIDRTYRVVLSKHFTENSLSNYNLKQFEGKPILLPQNIAYRPLKKHLDWHQENVFKR